MNDNIFKIETALRLVDTYKITLIGLASVTSVLILAKRYFNGAYYYDKETRLDGKTAIVTGANTGIGKETALDLANRGARVILACRDLNKAINAADEIRKKTGNGNVFVELLDLSSFKSIRQFCAKINKQEERIDILLNNAGIMACPQWKTKDGFEMQFGTNHLGHFLLTNLLLDKIKQTDSARIVNVSSLAYERGRMNWDDINNEKMYDTRQVYAQSKLCNILFTRELAKRLSNTKVTVNALHPGVVMTELGRYFSESFGWKAKLIYPLLPIMYIAFKTVKYGAQTSIFCCVSPTLKNTTGKYFAECQEKELLKHGLNEEDASRLWTLSEKLCNL